MEPVYTPVVGVARIVFFIQGLKFTVTGAEHIPRSGGAVLAMNHIGYMDFTYAGLAARPSKRLVRFMAKAEVFKPKVSGFLLRGMKHIAVERGQGAQAYADALTAVRKGEIVGVFPEETISRSFEIKELKAGAARMAAESGAPLIPLVLWGSQRVWTKGVKRRLGRTNTPIHIVVGEPIHVAPDADILAVTEDLRTRMIAMLHGIQAAYPPMPEGLERFQPARLGGQAPTMAEAKEYEQRDRDAWAKRARERAEQDKADRAKRQGDAT